VTAALVVAVVLAYALERVIAGWAERHTAARGEVPIWVKYP
jgi:hypothetical protein